MKSVIFSQEERDIITNFFEKSKAKRDYIISQFHRQGRKFRGAYLKFIVHDKTIKSMIFRLAKATEPYARDYSLIDYFDKQETQVFELDYEQKRREYYYAKY